MKTIHFPYYSSTQSLGDPKEYNIWRHLSTTRKELVCVVEGHTEAEDMVLELELEDELKLHGVKR